MEEENNELDLIFFSKKVITLSTYSFENVMMPDFFTGQQNDNMFSLLKLIKKNCLVTERGNLCISTQANIHIHTMIIYPEKSFSLYYLLLSLQEGEKDVSLGSSRALLAKKSFSYTLFIRYLHRFAHSVST